LSTSSLPSTAGRAAAVSIDTEPLALMASSERSASLKLILVPAIATVPEIASGPKPLPLKVICDPAHFASWRTDLVLRSMTPPSFTDGRPVTRPEKLSAIGAAASFMPTWLSAPSRSARGLSTLTASATLSPFQTAEPSPVMALPRLCCDSAMLMLSSCSALPVR